MVKVLFIILIKKEHLYIPKLLIRHGANVNARDNYLATPLTSLCSILKKGELADAYHPYIKLLIENVAKLDLKDAAGETALFYAIRAGRIENIRILLKLGAKKDMKNNKGITPIMSAGKLRFNYSNAVKAFKPTKTASKIILWFRLRILSLTLPSIF
jgi:ankyrin repeat protein